MTTAGSQDISTMQLTCPDCGWSGLGIECVDDEILEGVLNRSCPTCGRTLVLGDRIFAWVLEEAQPTQPAPDRPARREAGEDEDEENRSR